MNTHTIKKRFTLKVGCWDNISFKDELDKMAPLDFYIWTPFFDPPSKTSSH